VSSLAIVLWQPTHALWVVLRQIELRGTVALLGSEAVEPNSFGVVLRHAPARAEHYPAAVHGSRSP